MKTTSGFTVIEALVGIVFLIIVAAIGFDRYGALQIVHRDHDRKIAINTMHASLEEVVRPTLGGYPRVITSESLKAVDKKMLKDPRGYVVGDKASDYRYEPTGCNGGDICSGYSLLANLEREADFIKTN